MPVPPDSLRSLARCAPLPWGGEGDVLSIDAVRELAERHSVPGRVVEAAALKADIHPLRYLRNQQSVTTEQQIRLLESAVALVGLGGLGGILLDQLARVGVGRIHCADGDVFEESNLNRQALCSPSSLGLAKTGAALERVASINPSIEVTSVNEYLTPKSLPAFLGGTDLAIDALGGLDTRLHLQRAAADGNIPMVTGALAGWTGYVGVVLPGEIGPADIMGSDNGAEEKLGCPTPAVNVFASLMAAEIVRLLVGTPSPLAGKMLVADLHTMTFETVSLT